MRKKVHTKGASVIKILKKEGVAKPSFPFFAFNDR